MRIVITGGGTGGHATSALSVYSELQKHFKERLSALYIGSHNGIEKDLVQKLDIRYRSIPTGKLRRYFSFDNFIDIFKVIAGVFSAFFILRLFKPNILFSTGGFVSVPVVIAAWLLRINIIIHEQTALVGLANRFASVFAKKIAISFKSSSKYFPKQKLVYTGQPIREELMEGNAKECYRQFGLAENDAEGGAFPLLYVTGGSQGSHKINILLKENLNCLLKYCNIIHQCGKTTNHDDFRVLEEYRQTLDYKDRYVLRDFICIDELKNILTACSLLIGRSGAGTVHEVMAFNIPAIFIPLSIARGNEQYYNAKVLEDAGNALIIEEAKLNKDSFKKAILSFIKDKDKQRKSKAINIADANKEILKLIIDTQ